jgi:hypothetical protein
VAAADRQPDIVTCTLILGGRERDELGQNDRKPFAIAI